MYHGVRGDIAGGSYPVLNNELLAKSVRELLRDEPSDGVLRSAGSDADDETHRPRWIRLCAGSAGQCRESGTARRHVEKPSSVRRFHNVPLIVDLVIKLCRQYR
jgi:hypothetical protein